MNARPVWCKMLVIIRQIEEAIKEHKELYRKGSPLWRLQYDQIRLPPVMIADLEELIETYYKYKDLCK